jgi:hypothetical protein
MPSPHKQCQYPAPCLCDASFDHVLQAGGSLLRGGRGWPVEVLIIHVNLTHRDTHTHTHTMRETTTHRKRQQSQEKTVASMTWWVGPETKTLCGLSGTDCWYWRCQTDPQTTPQVLLGLAPRQQGPIPCTPCARQTPGLQHQQQSSSSTNSHLQC